MKRVLFIYNQAAGKHKTWEGLAEMINAMTQQSCLVTAYPTQYPGDAGDAIVRWWKDYDQMVVAGGDGTLSQALAGVIQLDEPPLVGYIPVGTTNDFSRNLEFSSSKLSDLAATAVTGRPVTHDIGLFNGRSFLYVAAFGAFTEITYTTPQKAKNLLGYNAYILESIKAFPTAAIKSHHLKIEYDGHFLEGDYVYGMVSNTTSVGRFRNFPPGNPDLSDGLFEVTLISPVRDVESMGDFTKALLTSDPAALGSMLTTFTASHVSFTCEAGLKWTLDGEDGGEHIQAQADILPHAFLIRHGDGQGLPAPNLLESLFPAFSHMKLVREKE